MSQDSQLQQAVLAEFAWEPSVSAFRIGGPTRAGIVTLIGHIQPPCDREVVVAAAWAALGTAAVLNDIAVL